MGVNVSLIMKMFPNALSELYLRIDSYIEVSISSFRINFDFHLRNFIIHILWLSYTRNRQFHIPSLSQSDLNIKVRRSLNRFKNCSSQTEIFILESMRTFNMFNGYLFNKIK